MLWYVEMQPDVEDAPLPMPMIVINPRFTRKPEADQRFIGLVLPEAIRRIIMEMAIHDDHFGREKWFERWDTYLKTLCPGGIDGIRGDYNGTQEDDIRCLDERIRRIVPIILKGKHLLALTD
jgi:hypothetical protein